MDSFRHKGTCSRVEAVRDRVGGAEGRLTVFRHDLSAPFDHVLERRIIEACGGGPPDAFFCIAADSAVERSITDPVACLRNNFEVSLTMLELARRVRPALYLHLSTDECFGEAPPSGGHREWDPYLPSNPYAASKAAQDMMAVSYWRSYDLPVVIVHSMNVIGEWQDREKFLPRLVWKIHSGQRMEIYSGADGRPGSRFYVHAETFADALLFVAGRPIPRFSEGATRPAKYNIVGDEELDNLEVARIVAGHMGRPLEYDLVPSGSLRPGYDRRYALDGSLLSSLGWRPRVSSRDGIRRVVDWALDHPCWI